MQFLRALGIILIATSTIAYKFERIDKNDVASLVVDHQVGLYPRPGLHSLGDEE